MSESQPLFVRLPAAAAEQLDQLARDRGASKREIVTRLILDNDLTLGRHAFHPTTDLEVLTPGPAAELLQIDEQLVLELAQASDLPARRLGDGWRISRLALLDWLAGSPPRDESN